ncbi:MAG: SDR family NAD(P)-dependent oxidoreductase [Spirosomataceae bacterium]
MKNTVTIVTGAASGIGQQVAIQAAQLGTFVLATDVNTEGLAKTKTAIEQAGGQVEAIKLDVSKADEIERFAKLAMPKLQERKLILINNAGVALASGTFAETTLDEFEWLLSINLWGVVRMTKAFLPYMLEQNQGHIVNISSVFGLAGVMNQSAYCTAKFGVRGFTECLRMELLDTQVRTTVVHPGGIKTNIAASARVGSTKSQKERDFAANTFAQIVPTTAEEAARQILNCVIKNKPRLVIGRDGKGIDLLTRLMPAGYTKSMRKEIEKTFGKGF